MSGTLSVNNGTVNKSANSNVGVATYLECRSNEVAPGKKIDILNVSS